MTSPPGPVTEIAYIPLKKNIDIEVPSTPESKAWTEALEIIRGQDGYLGSRYGRQVENPDILMWLIDWESYNSHITFMNSSAYPGFLGKFSLILDGKPKLCHFLPRVVRDGEDGGKEVVLEGVGCTEFGVFYGVGGGFGGNVEKFVKALDQGKESIEGYHGACFGGVIEDLKKGGDDAEGEKGKAFVLFIGWDSKEAHLKFRNENPIFKENIWLLREENGGAEVVHVKFKKVA